MYEDEITDLNEENLALIENRCKRDWDWPGPLIERLIAEIRRLRAKASEFKDDVNG